MPGIAAGMPGLPAGLPGRPRAARNPTPKPQPKPPLRDVWALPGCDFRAMEADPELQALAAQKQALMVPGYDYTRFF